MEQITLTAATIASEKEAHARLNRLWIGQEEVSIQGRSIPQWLAEMRRQGWRLTSARATPTPSGAFCEFDFRRKATITAQ